MSVDALKQVDRLHLAEPLHAVALIYAGAADGRLPLDYRRWSVAEVAERTGLAPVLVSAAIKDLLAKNVLRQPTDLERADNEAREQR